MQSSCRHRWKDTIKMNLKYICWEGGESIYLAHSKSSSYYYSYSISPSSPSPPRALQSVVDLGSQYNLPPFLTVSDYRLLVLGAFAKLRKANIGSVRPNGIRLSLYGFSSNLISDYFSKICRENSSLIKIGQE